MLEWFCDVKSKSLICSLGRCTYLRSTTEQKVESHRQTHLTHINTCEYCHASVILDEGGFLCI